MYHVSSVLNRASIAANGLDWRLMSASSGIAGSARPEIEGCFLCIDEWESTWFAEQINNTGGPVDVWEVADIAPGDLVETASGFSFYPGPIPASSLRLLRRG
jgi:hypothetical protein